MSVSSRSESHGNWIAEEDDHNALEQLVSYYHEIDELTHDITTDSITQLRTIVGDANTYLKDCVEYLKIIGGIGDEVAEDVKSLAKLVKDMPKNGESGRGTPNVLNDANATSNVDENARTTSDVADAPRATPEVGDNARASPSAAATSDVGGGKSTENNPFLDDSNKPFSNPVFVLKKHRTDIDNIKGQLTSEEKADDTVKEARAIIEEVERSLGHITAYVKKIGEARNDLNKRAEAVMKDIPKIRNALAGTGYSSNYSNYERSRAPASELGTVSNMVADGLKQIQPDVLRTHNALDDTLEWAEWICFTAADLENPIEDVPVCYINKMDSKIARSDLEFSARPMSEVAGVLDPMEAVVSRVIQLRAVMNELDFDEEITIKVLVVYEPDSRSQLVAYVRSNEQEWFRVPVQVLPIPQEDATGPFKNYAQFQLKCVDDITIFVAKTTTETVRKITSAGGKVKAKNDPSVTVIVPGKTFKKSGTIHLKTVPKEMVDKARKRLKDSNKLLVDTGPMIHLSIQGHEKGEKSIQLHVSLPEPKKDKKKESEEFKTRTFKNHVNAMTSVDGKQWVKYDKPVEERGNGLFVINMVATVNQRIRLLLFRSRSPLVCDNLPLAQNMAKDIAEKLKQNPAKLLVRQLKSDKSKVVIQCVATDSVDDVMRQLKKAGYSEGPDPGKEIFLSEGAQLEVKCLNLELEEYEPIRMTFTQQMHTARWETVIEEEESRRKEAKKDGGYIQIKIADTENTDNRDKENKVLDELKITVPKRRHREERSHNDEFGEDEYLAIDY